MGRSGAVMLIGYSLGLPTGSFLALLPGGYRAPFFVGGAFATCAALFTIFVLPSSKEVTLTDESTAAVAKPAAGSADKPAPPPADGWTPSKSAQLALLSAGNFMFQAVAGLLVAVFPMYIEMAFDWGPRQLGAILTFNTVCGAVTQMVFFGNLSKLLGLMPLAVLGFTLNTIAIALQYVGVLLIGYADLPGPPPIDSVSFIVFMAGTVMQVLAYQIGASTIAPAFSLLAGSEYQGRLMGLQSGAEQAGRVLAPIALTFIYQTFGEAAPFFVCLVCVGSSTLCMLGVKVIQMAEARTAPQQLV